jgi:4'-phosphopantetheinyl transferase
MADLPADDDWLTPPEAERLQGFAYTKRREEARLGRWTAKLTLAGVLGLDAEPKTLRELVVRNASDGAPEVFVDNQPAGLSISMTDRADWAVCAVVHADTSIGCDLELVERRTPAFVRDWFTDREQSFVAARPDDHDLLANLIWSAKESALKVLRTGLRRDTRSVDVDVDVDDRPADDSEQWGSLVVTSAEGDRFAGWWTLFGEFVLTYVSAEATDPPLTLHEPSPLATASPSHTWMNRPLRHAAHDHQRSDPR